jgi:hypothetical protein
MMKICQYHGMLQYKFIANIKWKRLLGDENNCGC